MKPTDDDDLLTVTPASLILRLSDNGTRLLADSGALPCLRTATGVRLFRRRDVEELARRRAEGGRRGAGELVEA